MKSIRSFLIAVIIAAIVLVLFIAVVQGYRKGIDQTQQVLDGHLGQTARLLGRMADSGVTTLPSENDLLYQIFEPSGALVARSTKAPDQPMWQQTNDALGETSFQGQRWRVLTRHSPSGRYVVQVAENVHERFAIAEQIVNATLWPIFLGMPILIVLAWGIVTVGLRHLRALATAVAERNPDNLTQLELQGSPSELQPVIDSMNDMLGQVSASFDREQRFASDAAHELRTPISALKINVYNLRRKLGDDSELRGVASSLDRMSHLIDQLLLLYRTGSDNLRSEFSAVDLGQLIREIIRDRYPDIQRRRQDIELDGNDIVVSGNRFALTAMMTNLIDNASKYTPDGGIIRVSLSSTGPQAQVVVEDNGMGIPPALRQRVTDRFFRVESAAGISGCGLGLSIVNTLRPYTTLNWPSAIRLWALALG